MLKKSSNSHLILILLFSILVTFFIQDFEETPEYFASIKLNQTHEELFYMSRNSNNLMSQASSQSESELFSMDDRANAMHEIRKRIRSYVFFNKYIDNEFREIQKKYAVEINKSFIGSFLSLNSSSLDNLSSQQNYKIFWESINIRANRENAIEIRSINTSDNIAIEKINILVSSYNKFIKNEKISEYKSIASSINDALANNIYNIESKNFLNNLYINNTKSILLESSTNDNYIQFIIEPEQVNWKQTSKLYKFFFSFVIVFGISILLYNISKVIREV